MGYLNKVICSYEPLTLNVQAKHKTATMTYISWFSSFALYFQEHMMYGHYDFDYESIGSLKLRGPSHDNHLTVYSNPWCYHIDRFTTRNEPLTHHKKLMLVQCISPWSILTWDTFISQPY